jgi:hypothetical protein
LRQAVEDGMGDRHALTCGGKTQSFSGIERLRDLFLSETCLA